MADGLMVRTETKRRQAWGGVSEGIATEFENGCFVMSVDGERRMLAGSSVSTLFMLDSLPTTLPTTTTTTLSLYPPSSSTTTSARPPQGHPLLQSGPIPISDALPTSAGSSTSPVYHPSLPLPLVPAKRKRSTNATSSPSVQLPAVVDGVLANDASSRLHPPVLGLHQSDSPDPSWYSHKSPQPSLPPTQATEDISCICAFTHDDGNTIQCDNCRQWSHMTCYELKQNSISQSDEWLCVSCKPRPVNYSFAKTYQTSYLNALYTQEKGKRRAAGEAAVGVRGGLREEAAEKGKKRGRRNNAKPPSQATPLLSGGVASNSAGKQNEGNALGSAGGEKEAFIPPGAATQDTFVDVEDDWRGTYVPLDADRIPDASTRAKLAYSTQDWRGLTALSITPPGSPSQRDTRVVCVEGGAKDKEGAADVETAVRPARYGLQTTKPINEEELIAPFTSTIVPSASYLADPLNAYSHLGTLFISICVHPSLV